MNASVRADVFPASGGIRSVADTAFWAAGIRAREQRAQVPAFIDEWAEYLAGEKGISIARRFERASELEWGVIMRTASMDRLLAEALREGIDTVLNLGAGLDSRPYRLVLPGELRWIEVDLPEIVDYKESRLAEHHARCAVERHSLDLTSARQRERLRTLCRYGNRKVLVLSEGLLPYLPTSDVEAIATWLYQEPAVQHWLLDFDAAGGLGWSPTYRQELCNAPRRLDVPELLPFLRQAGWECRVAIGAGEEGESLSRPFPIQFPHRLLWRLLPAQWQSRIKNLSGVAELAKI